MKVAIRFMLIFLITLLPRPVLADDEVEKTYCAAVPNRNALEELKLEILATAKRMAINDLFGELIIANVYVENFVVTRDQIQTSSMGFVRTRNVEYHYNRAGDLCVTITTYATEKDLAEFEPMRISNRYCHADSALTVGAIRNFARDEVVVQALLKYDRNLESFARGRLLRLARNLQYTESGFLPDTETFCATVEAQIVPIEIKALLAELTIIPTPTPRPTATPTIRPTQTPTRRVTSTPTPNRTTTARVRLTQTAETRATHVQQTVEAIQEATRVQETVAARLTELAPPATPQPISTSTSTSIPTPVNTPTPESLSVQIITDDLNVRTGPSTQYDRIAKVTNGHRFIPIGRDNDTAWLQICCVNGQAVWVVNNPEYISVQGDTRQLPIVSPPTPTPAPITCSIPVDPELVSRWSRADMGCPTGPAQITWASYTPFERGFIMWRRDLNSLYGFFNSGRWKMAADHWDGSSLAPSRGTPPPGLLAPIRGAGYIWGTDNEFFQNLGWATGQQTGLCARIQHFQNGFMLRTSNVEQCHEEHKNPIRDTNFVFIQVYNTQSWRR